MTAATSKVESTTTLFDTPKIRRPLASTAATYYTGSMICANPSTGYYVKGSDTAGLIFDGIMADSQRVEVDSAASNGDYIINVEKPLFFTMKIAAADRTTDLNKKVYVLYDNEVAFSTSNSILAGTVEDVINATTVLIRPHWLSVGGAVSTFDGNTLTFNGATGVNVIAIPDNLADALSISEGSNAYLTAVTTDGSEQLLLSKKTSLLDATDLIFGTGLDAAIRWSTGDASNHALVIALGDSNQALHVTDLGAVATDWNVSADTHPTLYVHSNTTPATDYMTFGAHDGTTGHINVAGGTTLSLDIAGTAEVTMSAAGLNVVDGNRLFVGVAAVPGTQAGANWIGLEDSTTDPTGTLTNSLALYTPDAGDSLDFLHADGTTDSLGT